jgi:hypothetical protein
MAGTPWQACCGKPDASPAYDDVHLAPTSLEDI